jgi:voltage-gated potassium channel
MGKGSDLAQLWWTLSREQIPLLAIGAVLVFVSGVTLLLLVEPSAPNASIRSVGDAAWFSFVSMTTVGYGDLTPVTTAGRVVTGVLVLGGIGLLWGGTTATIASILVARRIREERGLDEIRATGHLVVCGWNQYAERVLEALIAADRGNTIVIVGELPEEVASDLLVRYRGARFVRGDPASEVTLARANVRQASAAVVLADTSRAGADERTALVTLALKSVRPDLVVTAEAVDLKSESHLRRAGADEVVTSGEFNAFLISSATAAPGIPAVVRPLLSHGANSLRRVAIPAEHVGRTFGELSRAMRDRDGTLLIAIVSEAKGLTLDDILTDDTSLIDRFIQDQFHEAGTEFLRFEHGRIRATVNPPDSYVIQRSDAAIGIAGQAAPA